MENQVLVVGSMNLDLVVQVDNYPQAGQTITGDKFDQVPGGKGANQALAVGKLGGEIDFIGACGKDEFGDRLLTSLQAGGVNTSGVFRLEETTGTANITVEKSGENRIVVVPGANSQLDSQKINQLEGQVKKADIILLQLEVPLETVEQVMKIASADTTIILDPAPAQDLPQTIYQGVDYLLPNEGELATLLTDYDLSSRQEKVDQLLDWGVNKVLLTKGSEGVSLYTTDCQQDYQAISPRKVVDTTAAGDAFAGAFAYGLQQDWQESQAIEFAILAAGLSVTKEGAQPSLPTRKEVENFKQERGR